MSGRIAWAALAAMTVSFGLNFSAGVFFAPAAGVYGVSVAVLTVTAAVATALTGLLQLVVGAWLDRIGARWVLLTGLASTALSYLALAVVVEPWQFVAAFLVGGLGFAASSSLAITTLIGRAYGERSGPPLARSAIGITLGQVLVPWAATSLLEPLGLRATYAVLGAAALAAILALAAVLPADRPAAVQITGRESLRGRGQVLATFGLHAATLYPTVLLLPKHAAELGWSVVGAGRLVAVAAVAAGVSSAVLSRLLRRHRPDTLLPLLHLVRAVSLLLLAVGGEPVLIVAAVLFGVASFPAIPLTMALLTRGLDRARLGRSLAPAWLLHQLCAAGGLLAAAVVHAIFGGYAVFFALGLIHSPAAVALLVTKEKDLVSA